MKKIRGSLAIVFIMLFTTATFAASSRSVVLNGGSYVAEGSLVRDSGTGRVTAVTKKVSGNIHVGTGVSVVDKTYGVIHLDVRVEKNTSTRSYIPPYAIEDTIGAESEHGAYTIYGVQLDRTRLYLP